MKRISRDQLMAKCLEIAGRYGGNLTVRQLYYRMVAEGHITSSNKEYKRIVSGLSVWRMDGRFPLNWLIDRTRENRPGDFFTNKVDVEAAEMEAADEFGAFPYAFIRRARWYGQPTHVSVWVEKEALAGVFERPCDNLGASWMVLRGYASISTLYQWVKHAAAAKTANPWIDEFTILYFGDHDPDGFEIPRSAVRNIKTINALEGYPLPGRINFKRVALNMDQIRSFNPPPFPAKPSSSRFKNYVEEFGVEDAWELDALKPEELEALIVDSVEAEFDEDIHEENLAHIDTIREEFAARINTTEWIERALDEDI